MRKNSILKLDHKVLRNVFASSPDAITVTDLNAKIVDCNPATLNLHGFSSKDEVIGKNALELIAGKDHGKAMENLKKTLAEGSVKNIEYTFLTKDRREFPAELSASVVGQASGKPIGFVAIAKDITERRLMEKALRESERKLVQLIQDLPIAVFVVDADGKPCYENRLSQQLLRKSITKIAPGYKVDRLPEIYQAYVAGTDQLYPQDRTPLVRALAGESSTVDDMEIRHPDGTIPLEVWGAPILDEEGKIVYAVAIFRDITRRRRNEKMLQQQAEEIKELNESVTQRLFQKIHQIDNVSMVRERLKVVPDISTGLDLILNTASSDFDAEFGVVLIVDREENTAKLRAFKSKREGGKIEDSYPLDGAFVELEAVKENKNFSKVVDKGEPSILKTVSIHCAPIHLGDEVYGVLSLGSQKDLVLDNSDLAVLGLYAAAASRVFEMQKLALTPAKETAQIARRRFELEFGCSYLVKNDVKKAFEIFIDYVFSGSEGLCVTREFPSKVRDKYRLEKTPIVWLSEERVEGQTTVHSLQDLSILIGSFLEKVKHGVVLLDGFEYLITSQGFESFIRFLQLNRSRFEQNESILIAPLSEEAVNTREAKLIEREMTLIQ